MDLAMGEARMGPATQKQSAPQRVGPMEGLVPVGLESAAHVSFSTVPLGTTIIEVKALFSSFSDPELWWNI